MNNLNITKQQYVEAPQDDFHSANNIVAFQLVEISADFYGNKIEGTYDTKILKDGRQLVINGDGFIKSDFEIN